MDEGYSEPAYAYPAQSLYPDQGVAADELDELLAYSPESGDSRSSANSAAFYFGTVSAPADSSSSTPPASGETHSLHLISKLLRRGLAGGRVPAAAEPGGCVEAAFGGE